jgi:hypothetical protein
VLDTVFVDSRPSDPLTRGRLYKVAFSFSPRVQARSLSANLRTKMIEDALITRIRELRSTRCR